MYTRTIAALAVVAGLLAGASQASAQKDPDKKKYDKGSTVTLQGCVTAAEKKGTFVLTDVKELPVAESMTGKYGPRYYWINKGAKDLMAHLGHQVMLVGKITDVDKSEVDIKTGEMNGGTIVKIEGPGTDVKTTAANANVNTAGRTKHDDIDITLLKVNVEQMTMTASTCPITSSSQQ
jgi:hypothetical protein